MKSQKPGVRTRSLSRPPKSPKSLQQSFNFLITSELVEKTVDDHTVNITRSPKNKVSVSDTNLNANQDSHLRKENFTSAKGDVLSDGQKPENLEMVKSLVPEVKELYNVSDNGNQIIVISPHSQVKVKSKSQHRKLSQGDEKIRKNNPKKLQTAPSVNSSSNDSNILLRHIRDVQADTRKSARIIRDSRTRLLELQKKKSLTESDIEELGERNELLLREMERFERLTKSVQNFIGNALDSKQIKNNTEYIPASLLEPPMYHEMKMTHPTVLVAGKTETPLSFMRNTGTRSKSEIDLTRKLNESYDMQEKLVADNADLDVKRYILYKELMTKDQNLETCRSQIKRLQGEIKLMSKENTLLMEKLSINNSEGEAAAMKQDRLQDSDANSQEFPIQSESSVNVDTYGQEIIDKLDDYKTSSVQLEKQLGELEIEVRHIQLQMRAMAPSGQEASGGSCRGGGGKNTCFQQPAGSPPVPPMSRACGVCPPCPASCNPNGPPTPAERELQRLTIVHKQTEENFKTKVTECAMLRADLVKKKEELEKERCEHREVQSRLRELEMKFEGLATHTNMLLGTKEEAFETEVNVRALKQCYRQAREEIDELTILLKEQSEQLQDYRVKYLKAQQLVEEQRRQMDILDMDNVRISEQINLEIHKIKITFQEKLQELSALPDLLSATQRKLKDSQQQQALAEHKAEQLARELACAREKVHILLHKSVKPPEKQQDKGNDEKQMAMLQQRVTQLTETNMTLKSEIERLKSNVVRMEEAVVVNEKRLQEKIHECAQLGGELDRARDEAARALQRANERTDTIRKCMQTSIAELERQLASSRAQVKTAEKEREEIQARMQCQIKRLNDNFEQAQYRILGLQTQVQTLRRTVSSTGDGEGDGENQECTCKTFFDDNK